MDSTARGRIGLLAGLLVLAALPLLFRAIGQPFLVNVATRIVIWAIATASLDLILGFGGMVSFGHAAYMGLGGYAVGILAAQFAQGTALFGLFDGTELLVTLPIGIVAAALGALAIGALSLRTGGVQFIMITLAFAQMVFFLFVSLRSYGGDDGLTIRQRSQFGGLLDLNNKTLFYYLCLSLLLASVFFVARLVDSRFGRVIQGTRSNERRMRAIGFPIFRYKLVCFVMAGAMCGLAGALLANQTNFISPAMMYWTRSGDLMVMVVLGGLGSLFGPLIGTATFLLLEEALSRVTEYSGLILGPALLLVAIYLRGGIDGLLGGRRDG